MSVEVVLEKSVDSYLSLYVATYRTNLLLSVISATNATANTIAIYDPAIYDVLYFVDRRNLKHLFFGVTNAKSDFPMSSDL